MYFIAECGITCMYDVEITKQLVDICAENEVDAIKFFFWLPDEIMADKTLEFTYETWDGFRTENMYDMLLNYRFTYKEWREVRDYCRRKKVAIISTINSPGGVDMAQALNLDGYKLSSWDYNYPDLWKWVAGLDRPVFIDSGPVRLPELSRNLDIMRNYAKEYSLLYCTHAQAPRHMNMNTIPYLKGVLKCPVGWSSNSRDYTYDIVATAFGAEIMEKRLTLDRKMDGHHHWVSLEPDEFKDWVQAIRDIETSLGKYDFFPSPQDAAGRKKWFRRLVADTNIKKGDTIISGMLEGKRGETGISPEYADCFYGRDARRDINKNEDIRLEDV